MSTIVCRAKISKSCADGRDAGPVYGKAGMEEDGTFDGRSVVCDACYIAGGQPSLPIEQVTSREAIVDHVNREMGID